MQSLPRNYDFKALEERALQKWKDLKLVEETTKYDPSKTLFAFLEGPPTANAMPGLHHVEARVFKDVVNRYQYMLGKTVPRKAGWDTHGLPVEVQVEKKLGLKHKKEIEEYGVEKFVNECRNDVYTYIEEWRKLTEHMAYWVDLEHPYVTLHNDYIESVWWSLKELFTKGYLYEGHKTVPFCPRCETSISSHEVAQGYKMVKDVTATIKFQSSKNKNRFFVAWTTTPWTLPGNMALAVNPDIEYAVVQYDDHEFVLAKDRVPAYFPEKPKIKETFSGKKLVGETYVPVFDTYTDTKPKLGGKKFIVIPGNFVTVEDGTGIVHIAPGFGEDDYAAGKENGLVFVQHVNEDGTFKHEMKQWAGKNIFQTQKELIKDLETRELLFNTEKYEHEYPHCWRCGTPLMYYAMKSWFINVSNHREKLVALNKRIQWTPEHIQEGRFGEWISNAKDWALSRKRYWGTPLPIWRCTNTKCGNLTAIGSIDELYKKGKNLPEKNKLDLHKPMVDQITLSCEKCKSGMKREPDVIDCWYDSGSAPFAQLHYPFENKELFQKYFPYQFIAEATDQTRGWFYTLHVLGALLFDSNAYQTVICAGLMLDEKGEKMSKSKENVINPNEAFNTQGVDAVRMQFCLTPPGQDKRFGVNTINENVRPFLNVLWNSLQFTLPYLEKGKTVSKPKLEIEDEWILSRIEWCREQATHGLDNYAFHESTNALTKFVNEDFSRTYIKLVRERAKQGDENAAFVFYQTWNVLSKLLAPYTPYVSEALHEAIGGKEKSVHVSQWPAPQFKRNKELETHMKHAQETITTGLFLREKEKINVRWPLKTMNVQTQSKNVMQAIQLLHELIETQLNVKQITANGKIFANNQPFPSDSETIVSLDVQMDETMEAEGFARELTRKIQDLRKKAGMNPEQLVQVQIRANPRIQSTLSPHMNDMKQKVRARELVFVSQLDENALAASTEEKVRDEPLAIGIYA